jgi:hypothetical protein
MPKRNPNPPAPVYPTDLIEGRQAWKNFQQLATKVIRAGKPRNPIETTDQITVSESVTVETQPTQKKRSKERRK